MGPLSSGQVCKGILQISRTYLKYLVDKGILTRYQQGSVFFYDKDEVERFARERETKRATK